MKVDALAAEGHVMPPFQISSTKLAQSPVLKAVCSFETNQVATPINRLTVDRYPSLNHTTDWLVSTLRPLFSVYVGPDA